MLTIGDCSDHAETIQHETAIIVDLKQKKIDGRAMRDNNFYFNSI